MARFTDKEPADMLKLLVELSGFYVVDNSPDKFIRGKSSGDPEFLMDGKEQKQLALYGTKSAEALIVNPLAEGEANSERNSWFYLALNKGLAGDLTFLMSKLLRIGADQHKKTKSDESKTPDKKVIELLTSNVQQMDEKLCKEFQQISKQQNFINIHYNKTQHKGEVKCLFFIEAQKKAFPNIRKSSWPIFEDILGKLLGIRNLTDFDYKPTVQALPLFESTVNILLKIYQRIQPWMKIFDCGPTEAQLGELESHLKYLNEYYEVAKWCVAPTNGATMQVNKTQNIGNNIVPWNQNSNISTNTSIYGPGNGGTNWRPSPSFGAPSSNGSGIGNATVLDMVYGSRNRYGQASQMHSWNSSGVQQQQSTLGSVGRPLMSVSELIARNKS